jgi:hypothetical protein
LVPKGRGAKKHCYVNVYRTPWIRRAFTAIVHTALGSAELRWGVKMRALLRFVARAALAPTGCNPWHDRDAPRPVLNVASVAASIPNRKALIDFGL